MEVSGTLGDLRSLSSSQWSQRRRPGLIKHPAMDHRDHARSSHTRECRLMSFRDRIENPLQSQLASKLKENKKMCLNRYLHAHRSHVRLQWRDSMREIPMKLQIVSKIFSVIYLFVIFAAEQGGSGLTVFDSCYIPGSLLSLIWSKLMKRRQGQHQPWAEPPLWHGAGWHLEREIITWPSASQPTKGIYDAGLLESIGIGSKPLRKERLLVAGTEGTEELQMEFLRKWAVIWCYVSPPGLAPLTRAPVLYLLNINWSWVAR